MADKKNILLAGLAFLGIYLFSGKDKTKNTTSTTNNDNTSSTTNPNLNTNASASDSNYLDVLNAKKELEATENIYSRGVYISDVTMQVFSDGEKHNGLGLYQFPYNYIIWAKFVNTTDEPVQIKIKGISCILIDTANKKVLPKNENYFIVQSRTETGWLPIVVLTEKVAKSSKYFDNEHLFATMKNKFPRWYNYFFPATITIVYDVYQVSMDNLLAQDVTYEVDTEFLSLPVKEYSAEMGFSDSSKGGYIIYKAGNITEWVKPTNRTEGNYERHHDNSGINYLNPDNNVAYQSYLDILRSERLTNSLPARYELRRRNNNGKVDVTGLKYDTVRYDGEKYPNRGKIKNMTMKSGVLPYRGIVYDKNGVIAYE